MQSCLRETISKLENSLFFLVFYILFSFIACTWFRPTVHWWPRVMKLQIVVDLGETAVAAAQVRVPRVFRKGLVAAGQVFWTQKRKNTKLSFVIYSDT